MTKIYKLVTVNTKIKYDWKHNKGLYSTYVEILNRGRWEDFDKYLRKNLQLNFKSSVALLSLSYENIQMFLRQMKAAKALNWV